MPPLAAVVVWVFYLPPGGGSRVKHRRTAVSRSLSDYGFSEDSDSPSIKVGRRGQAPAIPSGS